MLLSSFYSSSYVYKYFIDISTLSLYCKCFWLQPVSFLYLVFFFILVNHTHHSFCEPDIYFMALFNRVPHRVYLKESIQEWAK